jgi:hypothetical protein
MISKKAGPTRTATSACTGASAAAFARSACSACCFTAATAADAFSLARCESVFAAFPEHYQRVKAELLRAGAMGRVSVIQMEALLREASLARRAVEQAVKAARYLHSVANPPVETAAGAPQR